MLGLDCEEYAIRTAFKKEGHRRRIAAKKCTLFEENRRKRLEWAQEHVNWTDEQWDEVLWSDETWAQPGRHTRIWVTSKIGEREDPDCVVSRHQRKIGWMFWGSISGKYGRHRGLFWEKNWETINDSRIIIPIVDEILKQYPELHFQQDNAKGHAYAFTKSVFKAAGIRVNV